MLGIETAPLETLGPLHAIAKRTGHNAEKNGGWDPTDLLNVDAAVADDLLTVLKLASEIRRYPVDLGFEPEISAIWQLWRGAKP